MSAAVCARCWSIEVPKQGCSTLVICRKILDHNPNNVAALEQLASVYDRLHQYEKAQTILESAARLDPDDAQIQYELEGSRRNCIIRNGLWQLTGGLLRLIRLRRLRFSTSGSPMRSCICMTTPSAPTASLLRSSRIMAERITILEMLIATSRNTN